MALGTSGESSPVLFDLDDDGDDEIVMATADGRVHAIRADGTELAGWPVSTAMLPLASGAPAYQPGALGTSWNTSVLAPVAVGDLDDDGAREVVVADDGADEVLIAGNNGPGLLVEGDGTSHFATFNDRFLPFDAQTFPSSSPQGDTVDFGLTFAVVGTGAAGDVDGDTVLDFTLPSTGGIQLLDNQGPALQGPGDQQLVAWSTATGDVLPAFPRRVEDLQFLSAPSIVDIDGDAIAELLVGSGGYYLHAFSGTGGEPAGWPKFTGGWTIGSLAIGDLDGDDLVDVVAPTREGRLYAWEQSGTLASTGTARVQWPTSAHDRHRTGNVNSGILVGGEPADCERVHRGVISKASIKYGDAAADDKLKVKVRANLGGLALDPTAVAVKVTWGAPDAMAFSAEIPPGSFKANLKNTSFKFVDPTLTIAPGVKKVGGKLKKGVWEIQVQAAGIDAEIVGELARAFVQVGAVCIDRARRCELKPNGKTLVCR